MPHRKNEQFHLSLKKLFSLLCNIPPIINAGSRNKAPISKEEHKKNIPIKKFILWMLNISNQGLIEFVPKSDKTVQIMLESREDIFLNYTENEFEKSLKEKARIINKNNISNSKRIIFEYKVN